MRLDLHLLLVREGVTTAAAAARHLGISQALASHHLRQLAKYGFAEQVAGRDQRERPWRAVSTSTTWHGADRTDGGAAAADLLEQTLTERSLGALAEWQEQRREPEQAGWREITGLSQNLLYLTQDVTAALVDALEDVVQPLLDRSAAGRAARPEGARPVDLTLLLVPLRPTETGS